MKSRNSFWLYTLYGAVFLIMFALTWLTPMIADDFSYCYSWADNSRIRTLGQVISSMAVHRDLTNGRIFTHGVVQLLLIRPKLLFDLLNACFAVFFLELLRRQLPALGAGQSALLLLCACLLLWDITPVFGQVFFWLDGAVNYGWGVCLFLLFLHPYAASWLSEKPRAPIWARLLLLPIAFLAGTWSESGAPASFFVAGCLLVLCLWRDRRIDWVLPVGLLLELAGFLVLISAPAISTRAIASMSLSAIANNLQDILLTSREAMLPLYLLYGVSFVVSFSLGAERKRLCLSGLYALGGLVCLSAYCFAAYFTDRHLCIPVCFTVLAELLLLAELLRLGRPLLPRMLAAALAAVFLFLFPLAVIDIGVTYKHSLEREAAIQAALEAGERELTLELYVPATRYSAAYGLEELGPEANVWPNISVETYYGLDAVYGVEPTVK